MIEDDSMGKVDMSPEAVSERLRIAGKLSEELLRATFDQRYKALMSEAAELHQSTKTADDELIIDLRELKKN